MDVVNLSAESIIIKLTFETIGNHLSQVIGIRTVYSNGVEVKIDRPVIEAKYSQDSNTTTFVYTLSNLDYTLKSSGLFPNDSWIIKVDFYTYFQTEFDPRKKYSQSPSPNYICEYSTSYSYEEESSHHYILSVEIKHPPSFASFIYVTYGLPIVILTLLLALSSYILYKNWKSIESITSILLPISSAAIAFIPVYQLAIQGLKLPFLITPFDLCFIGLFLVYSVIVCVALSQRITRKSRKFTHKES